MKQPHKKYAQAKTCLLTEHSGYKVWKGVPFDDAGREQIYVTEDYQTYPAGTNAWGVDYPSGEKWDAIVWTSVHSVEDANRMICERKLQKRSQDSRGRRNRLTTTPRVAKMYL